MELAYYLAARQGQPAQFQMVFNNLPPQGQTTRFGRLNVARSAATTDGVELTVTDSPARGPKQTFAFDNEGRLVRRSIRRDVGTVEHQVATSQQITAAYPTAARVLRDLLVYTGLTPAPASGGEPTKDAEPLAPGARRPGGPPS